MCHQVQTREVIGNREGWGRSVADSVCVTRYKRERLFSILSNCVISYHPPLQHILADKSVVYA